MPDSYSTSPRGKGTSVRCGSRRSKSSGGRTANSWFCRGSGAVDIDWAPGISSVEGKYRPKRPSSNNASARPGHRFKRRSLEIDVPSVVECEVDDVVLEEKDAFRTREVPGATHDPVFAATMD